LIPLVADSSVIVKWFVEEDHSESARRLLDEEYSIHAPDLVFPEIGNILWKKARCGDLPRSQVPIILDVVGRYGFAVYSSWPLVTSAAKLAIDTDRAVYDCMFIALALDLNCPFVTADLRLLNALRDHEVSRYLIDIKDVPVNSVDFPQVP
jgi:predicted nucleic acid-binding protein